MSDRDPGDRVGSWEDARLASAFRARYGVRPPPDLRPTVLEIVAQTSRPRFAELPRPGRLAQGAIVGVVVLAMTGLGGLAGIGPAALLRNLSADRPFEIRPGPPGLRTLVTESWTIDFPDDWRVYDSSTAFSGGSAVAILTDLPVEPRCGTAHVDVNCAYQQRLEPGTFRMFVGGGAFHLGGTILSRADLDGFTTTRSTIGGMPALRDERASPADSYYLADVEVMWSIALPTTISNFVRLDAVVRGPGEAARKAQLDQVAAGLRFTPPPVAVSSDPTAAASAGYRAIRSLADGQRRGYLGDADTTSLTHYDCFDPRPNTVRDARIRVGPGGNLGGEIPISCAWRIETVADSIWEARLAFDWSAAGTSGRHEEVVWLDAAGDVLGLEHHGDPPPAVDPADPQRTAPPPPSTPQAWDADFPPEVALLRTVSVSDAIQFRDAGLDDRELAVWGYYSLAPPISCPAPMVRPRFFLERNDCAVAFEWLLEWRETLVTQTPDSLRARPPNGPGFNPLFESIDLSIGPPAVQKGDWQPIPVVLVGHFDDRRSPHCRVVPEAACRDRFVVDGIPWVDGTPRDRSIVRDADPDQQFLLLHTAADVDDLVATIAPSLVPLAYTAIPGERLGELEPGLGDASVELPHQAVVWLIRGIQPRPAVGVPILRTLVLVDGTDEIHEIIGGDLAPIR